MKILVFDDSQIHRDAAKAQLVGYDLTVVGTYDEAQELLKPKTDWKKQDQILKNQFGDFDFYKSEDTEKKQAYRAARKIAEEQATTFPGFDVVLTDLLVPASKQSQGSGSYKLIGQEMPVGIFIGLLAAVRARAKYVAVFTDSDHHSHPASACFDAFNKEGEGHPTPFTVEGAKVLLSNTRNWVNHFDPKDLSKEIDIFENLPGNVSPAKRESEWLSEGKVVRAKNWSALLEYLMKQ